ncbi:MAG: putative DNA-binding protein [Paraclostridium bifermentans]|uniref:YlxM family DNA-binding protein n=1 Tax=Paraclostridium bifermentans TaxID=1490 RepID=UPI001D551A4E|nr:putative DNA-binding protein [Paraclostridium bifermentans]MBS6509201.1 putative DNA-binding protein [Paraclostridium bifermentans]
MNLEKLVEIGLLFEQYKMLLTDKQREIVSLYYNEDYSLGEISENLSVSRQGIYDTLKRSEKILKDYEAKLGLVEKSKEREKITQDIYNKVVDIKQDLLQNRDCANLIPKVENIEDLCREMLK